MTAPSGTSPTLTLKIDGTDASRVLIGLKAELRSFAEAIPEALRGGLQRSQAEIDGAGRVAIAQAEILEAQVLKVRESATAKASALQRSAADEALEIEREKSSYLLQLQLTSAKMTGTAALTAHKEQQAENAAHQAAMQRQDLEAWEIRGAQAQAFREIEQRRDLETWEMRGAIAAQQQALMQRRDLEAWEMRGAQAQAFRAIEERRDLEMWEARGAAARAGTAAATGGLGRSMTRGVAGAAGMNMLTYGSSIPAVVGGFAVAAGVGQSLKLGSEFQKEMAMVRIASEDGAESIDKLGNSLLALGGKTMFAPTEMAAGLRIITQAGYTAKEAFDALLPVMNMAAIGETTVAEAADTAQKMMHAFSLDIKDVSVVGDVMTKVANISATNVKEMSQALRQASTVAKQYNVDIYEMSAMLGVLAKVGITGSAGGTALMNMLRGLYDPTSQRGLSAIKDIQKVSPGFQPRDAVGNPQDVLKMMQALSVAADKMDAGS